MNSRPALSTAGKSSLSAIADMGGLVAAVLLCFAAAGVGSAFTGTSVDTWYQGLAKPGWAPPDWVFGPVWTALYLSMAVAAWLVWRRHGFRGARLPLILFAGQLVLNAAWSGLFFGLRSPGAGFGGILLLLAVVTATLVSFWGRSRAAGLLLVPYLLWGTFAAALNFTIWRWNA